MAHSITLASTGIVNALPTMRPMWWEFPVDEGCVGLTSHVSKDTALPGYLIDTGYQLIYCVGTGALLGAWQ